MMVKVRSLIVVVLAVLVSMSAIGWVAAQDDTTPTSGFLGVRLTADEDGIIVAMVLPDTAAAAADLQAGDVITAVNGVEVSTPEDVTALISQLVVGDALTLDVQRGDEALSLSATLGERPDNVEIQIAPDGEGRRFFNSPDMQQMLPGMMQALSIGNGRLGVSFESLDADVVAEHELTVTDGALILEVVADSPAAAAGLQVDDVITAVNGEPVDAERTLRDRLFAYEPEDVVELTVLRGAETLTLSVTLGDQAVPEGDFFAPFFNGEGRDGEFHFEIPMPDMGGQTNTQPDTTPNI
jgi:S1-C subfamily serine protease